MKAQLDCNITGIFPADFINSLEHLPLDKAKVEAMTKINANQVAKPANIAKAKHLVLVATSMPKLLSSMYNFSLKFEGLGVIR